MLCTDHHIVGSAEASGSINANLAVAIQNSFERHNTAFIL
jgi:hypothetical protein